MSAHRVRVMVVFGTRPEAIKLAPVIERLRERQGRFEVVTVVTAQHREMLDQALRMFDIVPDHDLDIMRPQQSPADVTVRALSQLTPLVSSLTPDVVLVQGDTTTTLAAALASFYARVPVGHVEAGLRTGDRYRPFPEEMDRCLTSRLATWHFAPTETARDNLLAEGTDPSTIVVSGNTVIDALLEVAAREVPAHSQLVDALATGRRIVVVTVHRRENWGAPLDGILSAIRSLVRDLDDIEVVFPVHRNPAVRGPVEAALGGVDRIRLLDPLDYPSFVKLMQASTLLLSDSGGVQEEAPSLGKPVLILREVTERPEAVSAGTARLVGTAESSIREAAQRLLRDDREYSTMASAPNPFGDGTAATVIVDALDRWLD